MKMTMLLMAVMPGAPTLGATKTSKKSLRKGETSQRVAHGVRPAVGYKKRTPDAGDLKIGRGEASFRVRGKEPFVPTQGLHLFL